MAPRIVYSQNTIRVDEGERVILPCVSQAYPLPSYKWFIMQKNEFDWPSQSTVNSESIVDQAELIHSNSRIFQMDGMLIFKQALLSDQKKVSLNFLHRLGDLFVSNLLTVYSFFWLVSLCGQ